MSKELEIKRKKEIIEACAKLYEIKSFKEITIKDIGNEITFSRASIYNYYQTKEEIFIELFKEEFSLWVNSLDNILKENKKMTVEEFADNIAKSMEKRKRMLKLLSMNTYDIEQNCSLELVTEFKKVFGASMTKMKECLDKFFTEMSEKEKTEFVYTFFPFMYGIYPYAVVTDKQDEAMKCAGLKYIYYSI